MPILSGIYKILALSADYRHHLLTHFSDRTALQVIGQGSLFFLTVGHSTSFCNFAANFKYGNKES